MVRRVGADRKRQSMAIHNRHDFHAFSALRSSDFQPAACHNEVASMKHSSSFSAPLWQSSLATSVSTTQIIAAPSLKAPMHSFVVRVALRRLSIEAENKDSRRAKGRVGLRSPTRNQYDGFAPWADDARAAASSIVTHQNASASRLYVDAASRRLNAPEHASTCSRRSVNGASPQVVDRA